MLEFYTEYSSAAVTTESAAVIAQGRKESIVKSSNSTGKRGPYKQSAGHAAELVIRSNLCSDKYQSAHKNWQNFWKAVCESSKFHEKLSIFLEDNGFDVYNMFRATSVDPRSDNKQQEKHPTPASLSEDGYMVITAYLWGSIVEYPKAWIAGEATALVAWATHQLWVSEFKRGQRKFNAAHTKVTGQIALCTHSWESKSSRHVSIYLTLYSKCSTTQMI